MDTNNPSKVASENTLREKLIIMLDMDKPKPTVDDLMQAFTAGVETAKTDARLVELDLYEQFLNHYANKAITRKDLYDYKRQRLAEIVGKTKEGESDG